MTSIEQDMKAAITVCQAIHGEDQFQLVVLDRNAKFKTARAPDTSYGNHLDQQLRFKECTARGREPYLLVAVGDGHGFANENICHSWAIAVDFDHGLPEMLIKNPLVTPSLLIETSENRYHAVWILDSCISGDEMKRMSMSMAERLGGDPAFAKKSQLLRLPGFVNQKYGTPVTLRDVSDPQKYFSLDFLERAFDVGLVTNRIRRVMPRFDKALTIRKDEHDEAKVAEDAKAAVEYLSEYAESYETWIKVVMAFKPLGEKGKELAERFSRFSKKFNQEEFDKKWRLLLGHEGSVGTIFLLAQAKGWLNPGFRKGSDCNDQVLTDRAFGRMIADEMRDQYAVTEVHVGEKRKLTFLEWNGTSYARLPDIPRRMAVETAGSKVIAALLERKTMDTGTAKQLRRQLGTNRSLNEVCDHVAEALIPESQGRIVGGHPYLAVRNGVLNLISQELVPAQYQAVPMRSSQVHFDPAATAPLFKKTVMEIFEGDPVMVRYLFQLLGYILLGKQKEQIFVIFYGPTAGNGKNTVVDVLKSVLGDYFTMLPTTSIMTKSHVSEGATSALARLEGCRLALVSEPNAKHTIDSGAVKQMTGDRFMPVRKIYEDDKDINIEFVLLMVTNVLPAVRDDDHGLWRRIRIVPFNRKFSEDEMDRDLGDKLLKEASGILNLMLAGARDYLMNGLITPEKVLTTIAEQKGLVDPLEAFIADTMVREDGYQAPLKLLFEKFIAWQKQNPQFLPLTKPKFQKRLEEKGFQALEKGHMQYFFGLRPVEMPT